ncbi:MAG: hypothetical protein K8T91_26155 [Planctomycetes bacterium]|nr:hypothetical protein [Planctomycetota bacterium]
MSIQALRIPIRIVFYREGDEWFAHCLEFDLVGSGSTKPVALSSLSEAIAIQIEQSIEHGNPANLFTPADGRLFQMFAEGDDSTLAHGQLEMRFASVVIEDAELREYTGTNRILAPAV